MSFTSFTGHSAGIFGGSTALGATIVDGMDTLWIMGLTDRFEDGKQWIQSLNFDMVRCSNLSRCRKASCAF